MLNFLVKFNKEVREKVFPIIDAGVLKFVMSVFADVIFKRN